MKKNKQKQNNTRYSHVGKSRTEKDSYQGLLNLPAEKFDGTFLDQSEKLRFQETLDSQSEIRDSKKIEPTKERGVKKKPYISPKTWITKNTKSIAISTIGLILTTVLSIAVGKVWEQQRELGEISANLQSIKRDVDVVLDKYQDDNGEKIGSTMISIAEIVKDLEFLKYRLQKVENRLGL